MIGLGLSISNLMGSAGGGEGGGFPSAIYDFDFANKTVNGLPITDEISVTRSTITTTFDSAGYHEIPINTPAYVDSGLQVDGSRTYAGYGNVDLTNSTYWLQTGVSVTSAGSALNVDWYDMTESAGVAAHNLSATSTGTSTTSSALWWTTILVDASNTTGRYIQLSNRGSGAVFDLQTGTKTDCVLTAAGGITAAVGSFMKLVAPNIYLLGICVNKTNGNRTIIRVNIVDSFAVIDAGGGATTNGSGRKVRIALPTGCYSARKLPYPLKMPSANLLVSGDVVTLSSTVLSAINSKATVSMTYAMDNYQGVSSDTQVFLNKNAQTAVTSYVDTNQTLNFNEGSVSVLPKLNINRAVGSTIVYGWDADADNILYGQSNINSANAVATIAQPTTELRIGSAATNSSLFGIVTSLKLYNEILTTDQADMLSGYSLSYSPLSGRMSGVNMAGIEFNGGPFYPAGSLYPYFSDAGCKVMRLPFLWEQVQPTINDVLDSLFMATLDTQINAAISAGHKVILDPHNYAGREVGGVDYKMGATELPVSAFADLWSRLADLYKTNPNVIFGLMNEPTGITSAVWFPAAQLALDAIRTAGATNLVLVPGINFTSANSWMSMSAAGAATIVDSGNNMAFEVHSYMDTDGSGTSPTNVTAGAWGRVIEFTNWCRAHGKRGFLGEWATINSEAGQFEINAICKYMNDNCDVWLGWTWWASGAAWAEDYYYLVTPTGSPGAYIDRPLFTRIKPWII